MGFTAKCNSTDEKFQAYLDKFPRDLQIYSISVYPVSVVLYAESHDVDDVELRIIPALSDLFNSKWNRKVENGAVGYTLYAKIHNDITVQVNLIVYPKGTCSFKTVPTGRIVRKEVYVDAPEMVYVVDCGDVE